MTIIVNDHDQGIHDSKYGIFAKGGHFKHIT